MKKISGSTFYFKTLFPSIWFGFLAFLIVTAALSGAMAESFMFVVVPGFMVVFGFLFFKKLLWDLADEVYDEGDSLLFRKGDKEQRVYLKDIINISHHSNAVPGKGCTSFAHRRSNWQRASF